IGEKDVRRKVAAASSAMAMSRVQTTWSATGSSTMERLRGGARSLAMITSWADDSPAAFVVFGAFQERAKLLTALARVSRQGASEARHGGKRGTERHCRALLARDRAGDAEAQPGAARHIPARTPGDAPVSRAPPGP